MNEIVKMKTSEILKNWDDRESIQSGIEQAGFNVHTVYQEEVKSLGRRAGCDCSDINRYWNEMAREWVACAGKVDIRRRIFQSKVGYRSTYLDKLAEERNGQNISDIAALHPCERSFNETLSSSGLGAALTSDAESLKTVGGNAGISGAVSRVSSIGDLTAYLYRHLSMQNFAKSGFQSKRKLGNGLVLTAGIEKSKSLQLIQLIVYLKISIPGLTEELYFRDFSILVPGFRYNALVLSDEGVSYGLRAHAAIICEIARSFGKLTS
jgi:hypothetical protein